MELTASTIILLSLILIASHSAETMLGFGSSLIALALGALIFPLERLLAVIVLLGLVQSSWLIFRGSAHVHWRLLLTMIFPAAAAGTITGVYFREVADAHVLRMVLGGFVIAFSVFELIMMARHPHRERQITTPAAVPLLIGGGVFHGLFASGGPLVVYVTSRKIKDQRAFRGTLAILWAILGIGLISQLGVAGKVNINTFTLAGILLPAALTGIAIGERLRVNERTFQALTYGLLCFAGLSLLVSS